MHPADRAEEYLERIAALTGAHRDESYDDDSTSPISLLYPELTFTYF